MAAVTELAHRVSNVPVAVGFGIHTPEQAAQMGQFADRGDRRLSGIVELVAKYGKDAPAKVGAYVAEMKAALAK